MSADRRSVSMEMAFGTKERNDEIVLRIERGERPSHIAVSLGVSRQRVEQIARRRGVPFRGPASGPDHHSWKGGRTVTGGYVRLVAPDHPRAHGGYVAEHILVAEAMIGRPLKEGEVVHHINGVRTDNRPENLQVMTSGEHARLHNLRYPEELLLDWLRWLAMKVGRTPRQRDIEAELPTSYVTFYQRFGTLTKATVLAGLTPNGVGGAGHGGSVLPLNFRQQHARLQQYRTPEALARALHGGMMSEHERANTQNRAAAS